MKQFYEMPRYICACGGIALMHGKPRRRGVRLFIQVCCWMRGCRFHGRRKLVEVRQA